MKNKINFKYEGSNFLTVRVNNVRAWIWPCKKKKYIGHEWFKLM